MRINKFFFHVDPGNGIHQWVKGSLGVGGGAGLNGMAWDGVVCYGRWYVLLCVCYVSYSIAQLDFVSLYFLRHKHNNYVKLVLLLQGSLDALLPPLLPLLNRLAAWDLLRLIMHVMYVFIYGVSL